MVELLETLRDAELLEISKIMRPSWIGIGRCCSSGKEAMDPKAESQHMDVRQVRPHSKSPFWKGPFVSFAP